MYHKTKLSITLLTSLISLSAFAAAASSSAFSAAASSSSSSTVVDEWNDASHLIGVACKNGRYEMKSHLTEGYLACSIAHTVKEKHTQESLVEVAKDLLAHTIKDWRNVESPTWSSSGSWGKRVGTPRGEKMKVRASLILSLVLNRSNMYVSSAADIKSAICTTSKTHVLSQEHKMVAVSYAEEEYSSMLNDSSLPVDLQTPALRELKDIDAENLVVVVIDREQLLTQLPEKEQEAEKSTIS